LLISGDHEPSCLLVTFYAAVVVVFPNACKGMQIEILALRHQLAVLQLRKNRVRLRAADRLLWVILSRLWKQWRSRLVIVKPETVIA
jgi:hypothetical protein